MEKFYSTFEVARICHVSPSSVIRWIHEGKLNAAVTPGGHNRVKDSDLYHLLVSLNMPIPRELIHFDGKLITRILIVDDEAPLRRLIRLNLERTFRHIQIDEAEEGFHAGWKACGMIPDLILLDLNLPGMDGFKVCQLVRSNASLRHTKIIVITGRPEEYSREKALACGANDYLVKPFDLADFRNAVCRHIGRLRLAESAGE